MSSADEKALARRETKTQQRYTALWTAFVDAAEGQTLTAVPLDARGAAIQRDRTTGVRSAHAEFFLKSWPFKSVSNRKVVDIAVRVRETFSADLTKIVGATTQVAYFVRDANKDDCKPLLELHYDFETPVKEAHPIFHAQLGATDWELKNLQRMGLPGQIQRGSGTRDYANARIPTTFMGFGPILVMLAADHLKPRNFRRMMKVARGSDDDGKLDPECTFLIDRILPVGIPHADHWYDDRYIVELSEEKTTKVRVGRVRVLNETYSHRNEFELKQHIAKQLEVEMTQLVFEKG
jgi:hypothetical protein